MQKRHVEMRIGDKTYPLKTDESDERLRELEDIINDKFDEIKSRNPGLSKEALYLLIALEFGRENIELREEMLAFIKKYEEKIAGYSIFKNEI